MLFLKSVIEALNDSKAVTTVMNEAFISEFDVWPAIVEKSARRTKAQFGENLTSENARAFNTFLVNKESINLIDIQ